jgi:hypothetical protein
LNSEKKYLNSLPISSVKSWHKLLQNWIVCTEQCFVYAIMHHVCWDTSAHDWWIIHPKKKIIRTLHGHNCQNCDRYILVSANTIHHTSVILYILLKASISKVYSSYDCLLNWRTQLYCTYYRKLWFSKDNWSYDCLLTNIHDCILHITESSIFKGFKKLYFQKIIGHMVVC